MRIMSGSHGFIPALLLALAAAAGAQDVFYLKPARAAVATNAPLLLHSDRRADDKFVALPWPADRIGWFFVRGDGTQENHDTLKPAQASDDFVALALKQPGAKLIGADLRPAVSNWTGKQFEVFIKQNIAAESLPADRKPLAADAPVRVRRIESAKAIVRVAVANEKVGADSRPGQPAPSQPASTASAGHSAVVMSKSGQAVEIRLLADPTAMKLGSDVPVRTYVNGDKQTKMKVRATHESGDAQEFVTDGSGSGFFKLKSAGLWRIEASHAAASKDDADADWVAYSATLTFYATEGAGK